MFSRKQSPRQSLGQTHIKKGTPGNLEWGEREREQESQAEGQKEPLLNQLWVWLTAEHCWTSLKRLNTLHFGIIHLVREWREKVSTISHRSNLTPCGTPPQFQLYLSGCQAPRGSQVIPMWSWLEPQSWSPQRYLEPEIDKPKTIWTAL